MYAPVFQQVPDDWRGRWRLIRALVGRVYDIDMPAVGRVPRRAKTLKAKLGGQPLPPSVVEWMAFAEDLRTCSERAASDFSHFSLEVTAFPEHASIALSRYLHAPLQWGAAACDFGHDDPPVSTYAHVQRRNQFVLRKSFGRAPVTQFALLCALNYSPYWFGGWTGYAETMPTPLTDPDGLLDEVRRTKGAHVSPPFGSVTLVEGAGWLAFILNGYGIFGPDKFLNLRFTKGARFWDIPKPIRQFVHLKPSQLSPSRWGGVS